MSVTRSGSPPWRSGLNFRGAETQPDGAPNHNQKGRRNTTRRGAETQSEGAQRHNQKRRRNTTRRGDEMQPAEVHVARPQAYMVKSATVN